MVTSQKEKYRDAVFHLEDSCAHGSQPIRMEIAQGQIRSIEPETVYVQRGGG